MGRIITRFPAHRFDPHAPLEFGVQPLDDELDASTLILYVAGRRDEEPQDLLGQRKSPPTLFPTRKWEFDLLCIMGAAQLLANRIGAAIRLSEGTRRGIG